MMGYWAATFIVIGAAVVSGTYMGIPLLFVLILFSVGCRFRGMAWQTVGSALQNGTKTSAQVLWKLFLIAANSAAWLSSGCIAALIRYGLMVLTPHLFLPASFLLCAAAAYLLGSAFAVASTMGLVFYMIGCAGGVPPGIIMGAIISGSYVGDRGSPVSSTLFLLSSITGVPHEEAVRTVGRTSLVPVALSVLGFGVLSLAFPIASDMSGLSEALQGAFRIDLLSFMPAFLLLGLCLLFHVGMTGCLVASIGAASLLAVFHQQLPLMELGRSLVFGFFLPEDSPLFAIIRGGGVLPMLKPICVVLVSCALAEVLQVGSFLPDVLLAFLRRGRSRLSLFLRGALLGTLAAAVGCNQTMSLVTSISFMGPIYQEKGLAVRELFLDASFGSLLLATVPPWSLAVSLQLTAVQFPNYSYLPFMLFIYFSVLYHAIQCGRQKPVVANAFD